MKSAPSINKNFRKKTLPQSHPHKPMSIPLNRPHSSQQITRFPKDDDDESLLHTAHTAPKVRPTTSSLMLSTPENFSRAVSPPPKKAATAA